MDMLQRGGHVSRSNYTNKNRVEMYRCCLPGCGGAVLNATKIRQAFRPHCSSFHKMPGLIFVFHFEMAKGWEVVCVPALKPGQLPPGLRSPGIIGGEIAQGSNSAIMDLQLKNYRGNTGPNISRTDKYRYPKGKGGANFEYAKEGGRSKNSPERTEVLEEQHTGVFCFSTNSTGEAVLVDSWRRAGVEDTTVMVSNVTSQPGSSNDRQVLQAGPPISEEFVGEGEVKAPGHFPEPRDFQQSLLDYSQKPRFPGNT